MKTYKKLQKEYFENGINLNYMRSSKIYSLSIIGTPFTVKGIEKEKGTCQLTGYYTVYSKDQLQDVEEITANVFDSYREQYKDNKEMLAYVNEGVTV